MSSPITATLIHYSHDNAACLQLPHNPRQELPSQLLNLVLGLLLLLLLIMMLLLPMVLLSMLLLAIALLIATARARIPTTSVVPALVSTRLLRQRWRRADLSTGQIDVHAAFVCLGGIVEAQLPAHLLDPGFDLLHVSGAVVAFAYDDMQVRLPASLGIANACLEDVLGLLDELAVEVDGVAGYAALGVVLAEDILGRLLVVGVLLCCVALALVRERLCCCAVAAFIRLVCLRVRVNTDFLSQGPRK
jgi:hypothetical protein